MACHVVSVVICGYVPQGAGFYTCYEVYVIQWQRALVVYMSLGQLDSWLCYLSDVSTPSDAAGRSRRPENRYRPTDPKINRGLLLNKGYRPLKIKGSGSKGTRVMERKRSVTDGQTDNAKPICLPKRGRHKYVGVSIGSSWLTQTWIDIRLGRNVVKRPQIDTF